MRIKVAGFVLAVCPLLFAQVVPQEPKITKIVHVHGNAYTIAALVGRDRDASTIGDTSIKAVVIHARPAEAAEIEKAVLELDAISAESGSRKSVEVVAYLVGGSMGTADSGTEILAPVYKQLHAIFPVKGYQLLSTMLLRSVQGSEASSSGMLKPMQEDAPFTATGSYRLQYDFATVSSDSIAIIHLAKLHFGAKIPVSTGGNNFQMQDIGIGTDVELREGQKVVVGTSNVEPAGTTLFLVVTARLL